MPRSPIFDESNRLVETFRISVAKFGDRAFNEIYKIDILYIIYLLHNFWCHPTGCPHEGVADLLAGLVEGVGGQPGRHAEVRDLYLALLSDQNIPCLYIPMNMSR